MRRTPVLVTVLIALACSMTACSGSGGGSGAGLITPAATSTPSATAIASAPTRPATQGFPTDAAGLVTLLERGAASMSSAHVDAVFTIDGQAVRTRGDESTSDGVVMSADMTESAGTTKMRYIVLDNWVFAAPSTLTRSSRPWIKLTAQTSGAQAHAIYEMIEGSLRAGTNDSLRMVRSADSVQLVGTQRMDGVTVAHYRFSPKVTSLPAGDPLRAALTSLGLTDVPVQLYVDADGHPLKVTEKVSSAGHQVSATCTATNINAEVDTPPMPPPSMVQN